MKISVKNLGALKDGTAELGHLTVICGANNTGKTYLAYAIYGFHRFAYEYTMNALPLNGRHPVLTVDLLNNLKRDGTAAVDVDMKVFIKYYTLLFKRIQTAYMHEIHEWLAGDPADFKDSKIVFSPDLHHAKAVIKQRLAGLSKHELFRTHMDYHNGKIFFTSKTQSSQDDAMQISRKLLHRWTAEFDTLIFTPVLERPFIVTADRMGVAIFNRDLDANRNALIEDLQQPENGESHKSTRDVLVSRTSKYPRPISHEVNFVRELTRITKWKSELVSVLDKKFHQRIETMMGAKYVRTDFDTLLVSKSNKADGYCIPLHRASTAARELCSLYFYLKHYARKGDLLVIDEPESHLSSKNQVLLVRLLCDCVSVGMRVIVSTHSEIIMKEINNNIMLRQMIKAQAKLDKKHKHYSGHSGVECKEVKVYYCENGKIKNCLVTNWGMNVPQINDTLMALSDDALYLSNWVMENDEV